MPREINSTDCLRTFLFCFFRFAPPLDFFGLFSSSIFYLLIVYNAVDFETSTSASAKCASPKNDLTPIYNPFITVNCICVCLSVCVTFADCSCAGKTASGYETDEENNTQPFNPIATNGEPFPWLEKTLPTSVRPLRYMVTIHPNLTTLDVKGECPYII